MDRRRYRTEIVIPADRLVTLVLPPHLPEGPAIVTVTAAGEFADEADDQDIEWWEEFDHNDPPSR